MSNESPLSVNFKPDTGYDAPMLTIRADSPQELVERLNLIQGNDLLAAIGRTASQFKGQYQLGGQLGASHTNNPDGSGGGSTPVAAPPAPAPVDPWGGQPVAQQAPQQAYQAPAPVAQAAPAAPSVPGAPLVLGQPAVYKEGQNARGTWRAWADPRPYAQVKDIQGKTDNPNSPGLAAGTEKFWAFIR